MDTSLFWKIVKENSDEKDDVHGIPHVVRVLKNLEVFLSDAPVISKKVRDALEAAVILHDIGRSKPDVSLDHAYASAVMLKGFFETLLREYPHKRLLSFAVSGHSKGLKALTGKDIAQTPEEICLASLVLCDHLDAIGIFGIYRTIKSCDIPLNNGLGIKEMTAAFRQPFLIGPNQAGMKKESVVRHFLYNCAATHHIMHPVKHLVGKKLMALISRRTREMKNAITAIVNGDGAP